MVQQEEQKKLKDLDEYERIMKLLSEFYIDKINISVRASNCLKKSGIQSLADFYDCYKKNELVNIYGMGEKTRDETSKILLSKINEIIEDKSLIEEQSKG